MDVEFFEKFLLEHKNREEKSDSKRDTLLTDRALRETSTYAPLSYFSQIQKDLRSSKTGGLLLMSQGTGIYKVIGEYLDSFSRGSQTIFFLLNFDDRDSSFSEMNEIQYCTRHHDVVEVSNMISSKRRDLYNKGGVFFVSEVVLLFDLLSSNIIQAERITGFIINRAHQIRDFKDNLVWLCTLLKANHPSAIILALSESEQQITNRGLTTIMKWLYINRCFVWNMCRLEVQNELNECENQCSHFDSSIEMNKRMKSINQGIIFIIQSILNELKVKKSTYDSVEVPIFALEEFLNSAQYILEDKIKSNRLFLRVCLDNEQYVKDLFSFKQLQKDLFQFNCVQFYQKLLMMEANSNQDSFMNKQIGVKPVESAIKLVYENAQKRVYELKQLQDLQTHAIKDNEENADAAAAAEKGPENNDEQQENENNNDNKNRLEFQQQQPFFEDEYREFEREINPSSQQVEDHFAVPAPTVDDKQNNFAVNSQENKMLVENNSDSQIEEQKVMQSDKPLELIGEELNEEEDQGDDAGEFNLYGDTNDVIGGTGGSVNQGIYQKMDYLKNILQQERKSNDEISSENDPHKTHFSTNYSLKLNLDIDPKFKCLTNILNAITQKYSKSAPVNGEKFLIWIHTNDRSRVSSIQEYVQNTFLKNDPQNKLSLLKKLKYFLSQSSMRRQRALIALIKNNKTSLLNEKKESEHVLLETLFRELEFLFSVIEYEQLDLNKESANEQYEKGTMAMNADLTEKKQRVFYDFERQSQGGRGDWDKEKDKDVEGEMESFDENNTGTQEKQPNRPDDEIVAVKKDRQSERLASNQRRRESGGPFLEVKKRKLALEEKFQKRFKHLDLSKMDFNLIDELDNNGQLKFLANQILPNFEIIVNCTHKSVVRINFLKNFKPNFIILFEPNTTMVREITVYQHLIKQNGVNPIYELHTIMYNNSNECERALYNLSQENLSTERIVREKNSMASSIDDPLLRIKNIVKKTNTRIGGQSLSLQPTIITDKREFRSDLPTTLFHEGFKTIPIQLATGDYILSKDIAVERKSVETPDLVQSLRSGRLYQQLCAMSKSFKKCYLLIEFSESMIFSLEAINYNEDKLYAVGTQPNEGAMRPGTSQKKFRSNTITFYLPLIISQFENVRILWSKGPMQTARIFSLLKQGQLEPSVQEFLKEQDQTEKKESNIDRYIQANSNDDMYKLKQTTLFDSIKAHDEES